MKAKHRKTLELIFSRPTPAGVKWPDARALFLELGAELEEREGSRVAVFLFGQVKVLHRPHPSPDMDKGAVASIRGWLEENGVRR
ncbi:type II toxin-antitoxin system HicA family toxin [Pandoraea terrae]|uniref:type II toxin-antitoxin system HicA family toxin n=1 Tax=Pandoraea terrae TaxID=1537710 RepID=UPI00123F1C84|nr:type II toxin-antitoxin system HicA family toxin [Pandoraea terrae]